MECTVTEAGGIRALARVVQCTGKIGDEVTFAGAQQGLQIRTLNASRSACAEFYLSCNFFAAFSVSAPPSAGNAKPLLPEARVSTRALLPIFRAPGTVGRVRISFDLEHDKLVFDVVSRSGVRKTFRLPVLDGLIGKPVITKESCSSFIQTRPRFLIDVLANFHARLDEITFAPTASTLRVSSYVDDISNLQNQILRTEMSVDSREFDTFRVAGFNERDELSLTFYCKPFRAVLEFCENLDAPLSMWFHESGHPMIFGVETGPPGECKQLDVNFVFATRYVEQDSQTPSSHPATREPEQENKDADEEYRKGGNSMLATPPSRGGSRNLGSRQPRLSLTPLNHPVQDAPSVRSRDRSQAKTLSSSGQSDPSASIDGGRNLQFGNHEVVNLRKLESASSRTRKGHQAGIISEPEVTGLNLNSMDERESGRNARCGEEEGEFVEGTPPPSP